jgi:hypothetical protein
MASQRRTDAAPPGRTSGVREHRRRQSMSNALPNRRSEVGTLRSCSAPTTACPARHMPSRAGGTQSNGWRSRQPVPEAAVENWQRDPCCPRRCVLPERRRAEVALVERGWQAEVGRDRVGKFAGAGGRIGTPWARPRAGEGPPHQTDQARTAGSDLDAEDHRSDVKR